MTYRNPRARQMIEQDATIIDGVVRWNSNNRVPFDDMLEDASAQGLRFYIDLAKCREARQTENNAFITEYCAYRAQRTPEQVAEERFEARAAMGPGVDMVNVFTGERWRT